MRLLAGTGRGVTRRGFLSTAGVVTSTALGVGTGSAQSAGTPRWRYHVGKHVLSSPTVVDGTVYIGSNHGDIFAVDAETGTLRWQFATPKTAPASPTVAGGVVYAAATDVTIDGSSTVHAIDAETGAELWRFQIQGKVRASPAVANGTVYIGNYRGSVGSAQGVVVAVSAATGKEEWRVETEERISDSPTVVGDTLYVPAGDLLALEAANGSEKWRYEGSGAINSSPTVAEGAVFLGVGKSIAAVNVADGSEKWRIDMGGRVTSTPTVDDATVYVGGGGKAGGVYALATSDGSERWRSQTDAEVHSSPTVSNGVVYVGTGVRSVVAGPDETATSLHALDAASGTQRWRYETDGSVQSSPTVAGGTAFVGSSDGFLYAIATGHTDSSVGSRVELGTLGHHDDWRGADMSVSIPAVTLGAREHLAAGSLLAVTLLAGVSALIPGADTRGWTGIVPQGLLLVLIGTVMTTAGAVLALPGGAFPAWQLTTTPLYDALTGGAVIDRVFAGSGIVGWLFLTLGLAVDYLQLRREYQDRRRTSAALAIDTPPAAAYSMTAGVLTAIIFLDLALWATLDGGLVPWLVIAAGPALLSVTYLYHRIRRFDATPSLPSIRSIVSQEGSSATTTGIRGSERESLERSADNRSSSGTSDSVSSRPSQSSRQDQSSTAESTSESTDQGTDAPDEGPQIDDRMEAIEQRLHQARRRRSAMDYGDALTSCQEAIELAEGLLETVEQAGARKRGEIQSLIETARQLRTAIERERTARQRAIDALEEAEEILDQAADAIDAGQPTTGIELLAQLSSTLGKPAELIAEYQFSDLEDRLAAARERRQALRDRAEAAQRVTDAVPDEVPSPPQISLSHADLRERTLIGSGGSADVYRTTVEAEDSELVVAVKEPQYSGDTVSYNVASRIEREAERWQRLSQHDHIVSVLDYDTHPLPWIAMEYMDGGELRSRAGELSLPQALWTALCITEAIYYASDKGVVHLDLKPENILFREMEDAWDVPKVADWGLSKHLLDGSDGVEGLTLQYAAPEQVAPDAFGAPGKATDVYQLGVVFYELFTGDTPFSGGQHEIVDQITAERPSPPSTRADLPEALDEIIMKALSTEPSDRHEDVLYVRDDLRNLFESTR